MKSSEIKVGETYAYSSSTYSSPTKVTVIETGVAREEGGWSFNRRTVRNGVRVRLENGREFVATSREIRQPWADHAEQKRLREEARRDAEQHKARVYAERARQAKALDTYLGDHGEPAKPVPFFGSDVESALVAAGFEVATEGEGFSRSRVVHTRVASIRDFVAKGTVAVSDLRPVLADIDARAVV